VMSKRLNRPDSHSDASGFAPGRATRAYARVREPSQGPRWFPAPPGRGTGLEGPRGGGPTPLRERKRLDRNNRLEREVQVALQESPLRGGQPPVPRVGGRVPPEAHPPQDLPQLIGPGVAWNADFASGGGRGGSRGGRRGRRGGLQGASWRARCGHRSEASAQAARGAVLEIKRG
jgi:hypothetical protein